MYRLRYVVVTTGGILFVALFAMMAGLMAGVAFHFHTAKQERAAIKAYEGMVDQLAYTTGAMSAPQQRRFIHHTRLN
jgi:D-Tyr-tRNAtyr deacylase